MAIRGIVSKDANRTLGILLGIAGAALLAGHVATAQVPIRDAAAGAQLQAVTRILRPGVAPSDDDGITRVPSAVDEAPAAGNALAASAGLTINPIFDSTILSDPNAALIEATIYAAIADFQSKFSDPITVTINFKLMTTGLGQSSTYFGNLPYSTYLAALKADAKTGNDFTAIALLPSLSTNPVSGSSTINVTLPNLRAVGIAANPQPGQPDGIVYVNTKITNPGSPGTSGQFSLLTTLEHEIDEVLGLVSSLPDRPLNTIFSQDLYRYDQFGMRSFATGSNRLAYFSIDGVTRLAQYDNQNDGGDPGDWQSNPLPSGVSPKVQDAFATPGASPALSVELTALDVIGFDRASSAVPVSVTSLTPNVTSPVTVGTPITWTAIASGGTPPLQYQFLRFTDGVGWTLAQSYSSNNSYSLVSTRRDARAAGMGQKQRVIGLLRCLARHRDVHSACSNCEGDVLQLGCWISGSCQHAHHVYCRRDRRCRSRRVQVLEVHGRGRVDARTRLHVEQCLHLVSPRGLECRPGLGSGGWIHSVLPGPELHRAIRCRGSTHEAHSDHIECGLPGGPNDHDQVDSNSVRCRTVRIQVLSLQSIGRMGGPARLEPKQPGELDSWCDERW